MGIDPDVPPTFWDRRRLLLALSAATFNLAVLDRLNLLPSPRPGDDQGARSAVPPAAPDTGVGDEWVPQWPRSEPPARPGAAPAPGPDHRFGLVILGGRVLDPESGFDGLLDVGIDVGPEGGTITALASPDPTRPLIGDRTIDATGLVVAPGFIDLLSYEPNSYGVWLKLADGVTTNLAMHGVNNYAAPFFRRYVDQTPIHYGGAFHHHFLRGFDLAARIDRPLSGTQQAELEGLVRSNLDDGFAGVSFSPEYSPGTTFEEMLAVAEIAAERGHTCFFHVRHSDPDPPGTGLEAVGEVLKIAEQAGVSVHIEHLTSTGGTYEMEAAVEAIAEARLSGLDVTACVYPYDFWGTFLASARFSPGWQDRYRLTVADLQVAGTASQLTAETFTQAVRENKLVAALGSIPEAELQLALRQPWVMIGSDAIPTISGNNHPRGAGTCSRLLGRYVRELGLLDLMTGLAKLTILPALRTERMIPAMANKGRLQRGADADLTIFDPAAIADRATVAAPTTPSVGVRHVVVDGQVALADGVADRSVKAGRGLQSS